MDLNKLKESVYRANRKLIESGLVLFTFGNVSGVDRERAVLVIKPSGVPYDALSPDNMISVSLETGKVIDSDLKPSSDTPTHLEIYRAFKTCGGIVHTHSEYATLKLKILSAASRRFVTAYTTKFRSRHFIWSGALKRCWREPKKWLQLNLLKRQ